MLQLHACAASKVASLAFKEFHSAIASVVTRPLEVVDPMIGMVIGLAPVSTTTNIAAATLNVLPVLAITTEAAVFPGDVANSHARTAINALSSLTFNARLANVWATWLRTVTCLPQQYAWNAT